MVAAEPRPADHCLVAGELDFDTTKKDTDLEADADAAKVAKMDDK